MRFDPVNMGRIGMSDRADDLRASASRRLGGPKPEREEGPYSLTEWRPCADAGRVEGAVEAGFGWQTGWQYLDGTVARMGSALLSVVVRLGRPRVTVRAPSGWPARPPAGLDAQLTGGTWGGPSAARRLLDGRPARYGQDAACAVVRCATCATAPFFYESAGVDAVARWIAVSGGNTMTAATVDGPGRAARGPAPRLSMACTAGGLGRTRRRCQRLQRDRAPWRGNAGTHPEHAPADELQRRVEIVRPS